jgi:WD40 repeat protein/tRNA A-37 threonylcarbamoyl transferase component Bud32
MLCCLNPDSSACHHPPVANDTKFCPRCGIPIVILKNRYRPVRVLGQGGFGKTYLAEDLDRLNESCVIKQFAPQAQGTAALKKATELFEQEARRLQQLGEHSQIPSLFAYFHEGSRLYLVQQFIRGQNLLEELAQETFSEAKIRTLLQDLLSILDAVHKQKVIHRDLKPENVIRRSDGKVVLIDFGASKQLTQTVITGQGTAIGSFGYTPLEQMEDGEVYAASDLFSLGATCFHLLSGIPPWHLWRSQGYGWVKHWREHLQQPISEELGKILDKLLQEDYRQRYQEAYEVLQDLQFPLISPIQPVISSNKPSALIPSIQPIPSGTSSTSIPPTQPGSSPTTLNSQAVSQKMPVTPTQVTNRLHRWMEIAKSAIFTQQSQRRVVANRIILGFVGLSGAIQFYGYFRYGLFPTPLWFPIESFPSSSLLERTLKHSSIVSAVAVSSDGKMIATGSWDSTVKLWNPDGQKLQQLQQLGIFSYNVNDVSFSPDGKTIATGSDDIDKSVKLWSVDGKILRTFKAHSSGVSSLSFSPDGKTIATASSDNTAKLWNLDGKELRTLKGHTGSFSGLISVSFSPDGKIVATGGGDNYAKLWNLDGQELRTLEGHSDVITSVSFSPDGKTIATGSGDNTVKLWNLDGQELRTLKGHSSIVSSVSFSPDGKTIATGSGDNTVKLWNLDGQELRTLKGHSSGVMSVSFSPDGKTLISGSSDHTAKIWRLQ